MTSDAIKRLREYVVGKNARDYVHCVVGVAELAALLDIAEAAQRIRERNGVDAHDWQALVTALDRLPGSSTK